MRFLLDTHAFLWFVNDDSQLSAVAKTLIESEADIVISIASLWEIAIKISVNKLSLPKPFAEFVTHQISLNDMELLPISVDHLNQVSRLPFHHRDPFDRLIIAQSQGERIPVLSVDALFDSYDVERIW